MASPNCGTEPVELLAYFETGFPFAQALADEFTKQFPNVTWNIREDQFTNLMTQTPRLLSGDNPPDLVRLPTMVDLVQDGLLLNLDPYVAAFGWDQWPASVLAPHRVAESGRPRGEGTLYAGGLNYPITGVFYNKEPGGADRHDRAARDARGVRGLLAAAKEAGLQPDHAVERLGQRRRARVPAPEPHGVAGPDRARSTSGSTRRRAPRSTRPPTSRPPSTSSSGSRPATSPRTSTPSSTPSRARASRGGEGVFTFNGDWQNADVRRARARQHRVLPVPAGRGGRRARVDGRPRDVRHRRQREERRIAPRSS